MSELLIPLNEKTAKQLHKLATLQGIPVEQEASRILDDAIMRMELINAFQNETHQLASSLPSQTTDSADLIRQDPDNR